MQPMTITELNILQEKQLSGGFLSYGLKYKIVFCSWNVISPGKNIGRLTISVCITIKSNAMVQSACHTYIWGLFRIHK